MSEQNYPQAISEFKSKSGLKRIFFALLYSFDGFKSAWQTRIIGISSSYWIIVRRYWRWHWIYGWWPSRCKVLIRCSLNYTGWGHIL